jgi:predicted dithiol-disulfide oxidoreductase (DUF899 family)
MKRKESVMDPPRVVTQKEWLAARKDLLAKEKEFTHQREALAAARRQMPAVKIEKDYVFDGPHSAVGLRDLFEGRRQLIVYHLMFEPTRTTACKHCSCVMDNIGEALIHLTARDTSFAAVSRAPIAKIEAFKKRMGWAFTWVSSFKNDFNYDYQVTLDPEKGCSIHNYRPFDFRGELPGLSVFIRANDEILHSYSTYLRGIDVFLPMYHLLDATPLGRQEDKSNSMAAGEASWIRYHDSYGTAARRGESLSCCHGNQGAK